VDIDAAETSEDLRKLLQQATAEDTTILAPKNQNQVTFLQVISTWESCHLSPVSFSIRCRTALQVTDIPNSLTKFANTDAPIASPQYFADVEVAVRAILNLRQTSPVPRTAWTIIRRFRLL
jgi:hypothetical protein